MSTENQRLQKIIRLYKQTTGAAELNMHEVAVFAQARGFRMPKPQTPLELLAKRLSQAAREEIRYDKVTGKPYRANHAYPTWQGGQQLHLWIDIDEASRGPMLKSLVMRREQMVGDGLQLTLDADHWNSIHPSEPPIEIPLDLTDDVEWRKNASPEEKAG